MVISGFGSCEVCIRIVFSRTQSNFATLNTIPTGPNAFDSRENAIATPTSVQASNLHAFSGESLSSSSAHGIEVRPLSQTDCSLSLPRSFIIIRGSMVHAAIIPDRNVVRVDPSMPNLQVMVLHDELQEPVHQMPTLILGDFVDALRVSSNGEDALKQMSGSPPNSLSRTRH